jgi:hypothetical protein
MKGQAGGSISKDPLGKGLETHLPALFGFFCNMRIM